MLQFPQLNFTSHLFLSVQLWGKNIPPVIPGLHLHFHLSKIMADARHGSHTWIDPIGVTFHMGVHTVEAKLEYVTQSYSK